MDIPVKPEIRLYEDLDQMSDAAAIVLHGEIASAAAARGRCSIALAGGETPRRLYSRLASYLRESGLAGEVDIFFSDERHVPHDDRGSNHRMVMESLILPAGIVRSRVHSVPVGPEGPESAAAAYERTLREFFLGPDIEEGTPVFDIILLGIGSDGHTASLFPGSTPIPSGRLVIATAAPAGMRPADRISFTYELIMNSRAVHFFTSGRSKRAALSAILNMPSGKDTTHSKTGRRVCRPVAGELPAGYIMTGRDTVLWLDRAAGEGLAV